MTHLKENINRMSLLKRVFPEGMDDPYRSWVFQSHIIIRTSDHDEGCCQCYSWITVLNLVYVSSLYCKTKQDLRSLSGGWAFNKKKFYLTKSPGSEMFCVDLINRIKIHEQ